MVVENETFKYCGHLRRAEVQVPLREDVDDCMPALRAAALFCVDGTASPVRKYS